MRLRITLEIQSDDVSNLLQDYDCDEDCFPSCEDILFSFLEPYKGVQRDELMIRFNKMIDNGLDDNRALLIILSHITNPNVSVSLDAFPRLVKPPKGEGPMTIEQHKDLDMWYGEED